MMPLGSHTTAPFWGEYFCPPPPPLVLTRNFILEFILQWRTQGIRSCWGFFSAQENVTWKSNKIFLKIKKPWGIYNVHLYMLLAILYLWDYTRCQELQLARHYLTRAQGPLPTYYSFRSHAQYCYILSVQLCCLLLLRFFSVTQWLWKQTREKKNQRIWIIS